MPAVRNSSMYKTIERCHSHPVATWSHGCHSHVDENGFRFRTELGTVGFDATTVGRPPSAAHDPESAFQPQQQLASENCQLRADGGGNGGRKVR